MTPVTNIQSSIELLSAATVENGIRALLMDKGASEDAASITAEVMLEGTMRGYSNHGIDRLPQMLEGINNKTLMPMAHPEIEIDKSSIAVFEGNYSLGPYSGYIAMQKAIEKAKQYGIGVVGLRNAGHLGILGWYAECAAKSNCLGIVFSTSSPAAVVFDGHRAVLGTNPMAYSFPHFPQPVIADFATTILSRGDVVQHQRERRILPEGCAVNKKGEPTTDPSEALAGGLTTIGGHKGNLLSMLIATLAGPLIGGVANHKVEGTRYLNKSPNKGDIFLCFDIEAFGSLDHFLNENTDFMAEISSSAPGFRVPGKGSLERRADMLRDNIELTADVAEILERYL